MECLDRDNSVSQSSMVKKYRSYSEEWWGNVWYFENVNWGRFAWDVKHASLNACLCMYVFIWASLVAETVKNLPAMWETRVWSLGWVPREGNGYSFQYSCLERIPIDRGAWQATVHGVTKSRTQVSICIYFYFWSVFLKWHLQTYKIHVFYFRLFLQQRIISHSLLYLPCGLAVALQHSRTWAIATVSVWNISGWQGRGERRICKVMLCHLKFLFRSDVFHWPIKAYENWNSFVFI